jgi:hypothetical protein
MPYTPLTLDPSTPARVRGLIESIENHYFSDVHTMLKLPRPDRRLTAGCNFAIAQVLAAVVSGLSVTLYTHSGGSGQRFKSLLIDYFPWNREPTTAVTPQRAAETIYEVFRNPLTHDLGLDLAKKARTPQVKIKRLASKDKTTGLSERQLRALESTTARPTMSAAVTIRSDATVLLVEALYWGLRCTVEALTRDTARMVSAESFLARL